MKKRLLRTCAGILAAMMLMETAFAGNMSARVYADELGPVQEEVLDEASVDEIQALAEEETEEVVTEEVAEESLDAEASYLLSIYFDTLGGTLATEASKDQLMEARYEAILVPGSKTIREVINSQFSFASGEKIENKFIPVKIGYEFGGWVDSDGNPIDFDAALNGDVYCYANWIASKNDNSVSIKIKDDPEVIHDYDVVQITSTEPGDTIYYSVNNSNVKAVGSLYNTEMCISDLIGRVSSPKSVTIYALAVKNGVKDATNSFSFTVVPDWGDITPELQSSYFGNNIFNVPDGLWVDGVEHVNDFCAKKIEFEDVDVYYGTKLLELDKEYTLVYQNNYSAYEYTPGETKFDAAKAPAVVITGLKNYALEYKEYFVINRVNIADADFKTLSTVYNATEQKLVPEGTYNKKALKNGTDFKVEYPDTTKGAYTKIGDYDVKVTGKGNYYGTIMFTERITKYSIIPDNVVVEGVCDLKLDPEYEEGDPRYWVHRDAIETPQGNPYMFQIRRGYEPLYEGTDYYLKYDSEAPGIGKTKVTVIGIGNYSGEKEVEYYITAPASGYYINIAKAYIEGFQETFEYNSLPVDQSGDFKVFSAKGQTKLDYDKDGKADYTIEVKENADGIKDNVNVGEVTLIVKATKAPFYGEKELTFNITPRSLGNGVTVKAGSNAQLIDGVAENEIRLEYAGKTLVKDVDYTVKYINNTHTFSANQFKDYADNIDVWPTAVIKGKGNFKGTVYRYFTIESEDNFSTVRVKAQDKFYENKADNYKTKLAITDAMGNELVAGKDFDKKFVYSYVDDTLLDNGTLRHAGEDVTEGDIVPYDTWMRVTVKPIGSYGHVLGTTSQNLPIYQTIDATYMVAGTNIASTEIYIFPQRYTGYPVILQPDQIVIKYGNRILNETEYEITEYKNNTAAGYATVVIRGRGTFGGEVTQTFTIARDLFGSVIHFNANGGINGSMKTQTVTAYTASGKPVKLYGNKFSRPNYEFRGWNTEADLSGEFVAPNAPLADIAHLIDPGKTLILYAVWEPIQYKITVHMNGGIFDESLIPSVYTAETALQPIPVPDISLWPKGYMFGGWYKDLGYKYRISRLDSGSSGDLDLYAKWVPYTYTIKYFANLPDGKTTPTKMADTVLSYSEDRALSLNVFKYTGYVFAGWSENPYADIGDFKNGEVINHKSFGLKEENNIDREVELYAIWRREFNVTFDSDGGNDIPDRPYTYGQTWKFQTPVKEGYIFGGWFTDSTFKKKITEITRSMASDYDLIAKWTPIKYTVVFNRNAGNKNVGGSMGSLAMTYDVAKNLPLNKFLYKGYEFIGWNTAADGSGDSYDDGEELPNLTNKNGAKVTLYGQWAPTSYSIDYEPNGGVITSYAPSSYEFGCDQFYLPTVEKAGYVFGGWYKEPTFKSKLTVIKNTQYGDLQLYAKWTADKTQLEKGVTTFPITVVMEPEFQWNGKTIPSSYTYGDVITFPAAGNAPIREGYNFAGWYTNAALTSKLTGITAKKYDDITLYAKWTPKTYTVTYKVNVPAGVDAKTVTGKDVVSTLKYGVSTALRKNTFKIKGYTFLGWARTADGDIFYNNLDPIQGVKNGDDWDYANETLYAVWSKDIYTITYKNVDGITNFNPTEYTVDDEFTLIEPQSIGSTFVGWYSDAGLTKKVTKISKGTVNDRTLYAKWKKVLYNITYVKNDGGDENTRIKSGIIGFVSNYFKFQNKGEYLLPDAVRKGYKFLGWSTSAKGENPVYYFRTQPTSDMTVYAAWEAEVYKLNYHYGYEENGKDYILERTYSISKKTQELKRPARYGYQFLGWYLGDEKEAYDFEDDRTMLLNIGPDEIGDLELYAKWEKISYTVSFSLSGAPGTAPIDSNVYYANDKWRLPYYNGTYNGKTFAGWQTNGERIFAPGETVYADRLGVYTNGITVVFRAVWK